jgi:hypothetical protein
MENLDMKKTAAQLQTRRGYRNGRGRTRARRKITGRIQKRYGNRFTGKAVGSGSREERRCGECQRNYRDPFVRHDKPQPMNSFKKIFMRCFSFVKRLIAHFLIVEFSSMANHGQSLQCFLLR